MTDHWRPYQPGDDPLALRYMTPEQVADLVERARACTDPYRIENGLRTRERWTRYRAERALVDAALVDDGRRRLTEAAVIAIREARSAGRGQRELAAEHGVSIATISRVARGISRRRSGGPVLERRIDRRTFESNGSRALERTVTNQRRSTDGEVVSLDRGSGA